MAQPSFLAARLGTGLAAPGANGAYTGTNVQPNASGMPSGIAASASFNIGTGRDSLLLLAALVVGVIALSYWTR